MADIKFRDTAHRDFFLENMMKCRVNDCYHRAFFYVMGIASETRANINQMFNFKEDCIEPEGMHGGWQTSGTVKVCHLAFNLWNGYAEEGRERYFTPEELFCCEFAPYFMGGYQGQIPRILQGASCSQKTDGNFKIRKEKPMKNYKSIICVVAAVCLLGTAAFCGFRIYHYYAEVDEQTETFEEIAEMVEQAPTDETVPDDAPVSEGEDVLAKYQKLYLQNEDMVGWISIAGTTINYPVMQSRNNPNFYLKHNFEKEYSDLGTPYVQENCDIAESDNLVIYGHHIKGGKMFGALEDYKSKSFYEEHKNIQFDTLTEQAEYEIVAVFKTVAYSSEGFRYYDFVDAENEEDFNSYVGKCKELALYDTGVTAEYGDRLITLSTCEYSARNGRLVVVAKMVG